MSIRLAKVSLSAPHSCERYGNERPCFTGREWDIGGGDMTETKADMPHGALESAFLELVRQAVRAEVREILGLLRDEDRLLTIDQVAQRLSVSKDWVYRNGRRLTFTRKLGPKLIRFSEAGLQKWLKEH
jgi:excisionase family DNA binding protein